MLLIGVGTRPEYIKIKPLLDMFEGKLPHKVVLTGQHTDLLEDMVNISVPIHRCVIKEGRTRLDSIVASILNNDEIFEDVTMTLIQGDTASAYALALASFHRKIKICHLEAGLRTYDLDNPFPEEFYRQSIARMATINLCPTDIGYINLRREKAPGESYIVGNTVLDNLRDAVVSYNNTVLITLHRRENHSIMGEWFTELEKIAVSNPELDLIIPIHPNPNVQKHRGILKHVRVVEPLKHSEFVKLLASCRFIITDSGGIQEESAFLRKKCIVCRTETERVEGMGIFAIMCSEPARLEGEFNWIKKDYIPDETEVCPYGDGNTSQKIYEILKNEV